MKGIKLAVTGKGGVGKTTTTAALALLLSRDGFQVTAVDADPATGLGSALGFPREITDQLIPIGSMRDLVNERTGAKGGYGGYFKLNPHVEDLPDRFGVVQDGVRLLLMGGLKKGGTGCICPENAVLRSLVGELLTREDEAIILDLEAGIEPLTRGTAQGVDAMLVVVEPGERSLGVARTVAALAKDLRIRHFWAVGNKVRDDADRDFLVRSLPELEFFSFIPFDEGFHRADREGLPLLETATLAREALERLKDQLLAHWRAESRGA